MAKEEKDQVQGKGAQPGPGSLTGADNPPTGTTGGNTSTGLAGPAQQPAEASTGTAATGVQLSIKEESKGKVVGFNNSGAPLGERSQADILDLAIMARQSGNRNLLAHFDGELPELEDLLDAKAEQRLGKAGKKAGTTTPLPGMLGAGAHPNPVTTPAAR